MIRGKIQTTANGRPMGPGTRDIIERHVGLGMVDIVGKNREGTWYICKLPEGTKNEVQLTLYGNTPWTMFDGSPTLRNERDMAPYANSYFPIPIKYVQLLKDNKSAKDVLITLDNE